MYQEIQNQLDTLAELVYKSEMKRKAREALETDHDHETRGACVVCTKAYEEINK